MFIVVWLDQPAMDLRAARSIVVLPPSSLCAHTTAVWPALLVTTCA
ncbi:MAG: hypothetical protein JNK82_00175 [Myxococcaceae bacterium]|nr:hypothetical protein [Myxococcaceae bacterium]